MYIESNGKVYANYDSSMLFALFYNLTEINNLQYLDTSYTADMSCMFAGNMFLTELDLSSFDTSNVTNMSYIFTSMISLTKLALSSFDTSNVTNLSHMFQNSSSLNIIIYGSKFVYDNNASIDGIFDNCFANISTYPSWDKAWR